MSFAYWEYFMYNLMLPVFCLVFIGFPTVKLIERALRMYAAGRRGVFKDKTGLLFFIIMIVVAVVMVNSLLQGGIHLIYERSDDAVTVEGTLESIEKVSPLSGARYMVGNESSFGYTYTIDGVECTGMALGTLEEGDQVTATYLPKSGFVLSIEEK